MNRSVAKALKNWVSPEHSNFVDAVSSYLSGDHYQKGRGWVGPVPGEGTLSDSLEKIMVCNGVIARGIKRATMAVVGSQPIWDIVPRDSESVNAEDTSETSEEYFSLANEANDLLSNYFDDNRLQELIYSAVLHMIAHNRSVVRIYFSRDALDEEDSYSLSDVQKEETQKTQTSAIEAEFADETAALKYICVHVTPVSNSGVLRDVNDREVGAFFKSETFDKSSETEVVYKKLSTNTTKIEVFDSVGNFIDDGAVEYNLGGHLTIYEMRGPGLVTPDMLSMQRALDHNETMLLMNNSYAGFRERLFLNTEPPTFYQKINGKDVETDAPVNVGPGSTMFLQGVAVEDEVTKELKGYATPSVTYIDPVNQEGLINSIKHVKYQLHEGMFQAHLQISGDSTSSGQSRIQAVQDHISSLRIIERQASSMIKWLLETLLHFSAALSGNEGKYLPLKAVVQCKISPVVLTPEERTAIREEYNQELHSQEGAMTLLGVDNPAEEILKIRAEKQEAIDLGLDLIPGDNPGQPAIVPQSRT